MSTTSTTATNSSDALAVMTSSVVAAPPPLETTDSGSTQNDKKRALAPAETAVNAPPSVAAVDDDGSLLRKKQRKRDKHAAMQAGDWDRCMFKLVRKNRFCNIERIAGALFCGNHLPADAAVASKKAQKFKASCRQRVPCPVDARHTVYAYDLAKHVLVCNKVKDAAAMRLLPYYVENINSGSHCARVEAIATAATGATNADNGNDGDDESASTDVSAAEHSEISATEAQGLVDKLLAVDFADLVRRIHAAYDRSVGAIPLQKLTHTCCDALLAEKTRAGAAQSLLRHIEQQASILGHMERLQLLRDAAAVVVELGAGRGMLSLALAQTRTDSTYVLVDRAHSRGKADRFIASAESEAEETTASKTRVVRAKIDIRHLNFAGMSELADTPVVCMSKHLCGVATDLSLRAITQTLPRSGDAADDSNSVSPLFRGLAIALCCHHVCAWEDYVSPEFFQAQGFTPAEFPLLTSMTSWATCGMGLAGDTVEFALGMGKADRVALGRKCKRILDVGRAAYLERFALRTQLVHYCDEADSIENCLLLAWR